MLPALPLACCIAAAAVAAGPGAPGPAPRPWDDRALPVDRRVELLLEELTDEEKGARNYLS